MKSSHKIAVLILAVVMVSSGIWLLKSRGRAGDLTKPVEVGNIYDWNTYNGPLVQDFTTLLAEPLLSKGDGDYYVSRIANEVKFDSESGVVKLRDAVYWSDGVRVTSDHILAAFDRRQRASTTIMGVGADEVSKALGAFEFIKISDTEIQFKGSKDEKLIYALFTSLASAPIRKDLIDSKKDEAWKVTTGAYVPQELKTTFGPEDSVRLEPNSFYYRGKMKGPLDLKLHSVFIKARENAEKVSDGKAS